MHSGVQTYRAHEGRVMPAYVGIQGVLPGWLYASAWMTGTLPFPRYLPVQRDAVTMHNMC
jgi:hypothetical protein